MSRYADAWRHGGPRLAARVAADRLHDRLIEARLRIDARGLIPIERLVADWSGCHDYFPTSFRTFRRLMAPVTIDHGRGVFVDYGSGKGRVLLMAGQYPFRRIVGVEISAVLNAAAYANLARSRLKPICADISLWEGDAAEFPLPKDATVIYFYNPFHGPRLEAVLSTIRNSLSAAPRNLWILFNNTRHVAGLENANPWMSPVLRFTDEHECAVYLARNPHEKNLRKEVPRPPSCDAYAADERSRYKP